MSKNHKKSSESDRNKPLALEAGAVSFDKQKRLDCSAYQEAQPDMQFCWINDMDGEIEKYIDAGFEPVKRKTRAGRDFKGLTDRHDGDWERRVVGTNEGGQTMHAYLLMILKTDYQKIKIDPQLQRNRNIQEAMGMAAKAGEADSSVRDGSGLETYAPNLPTGGQGFEQDKGVPVFNKL